MLHAKLPHLQEWTNSRQRIAGLFDQRLAAIAEIEVPKRRPDTSHAFHLYVIRAKDRDRLAEHLRAAGIGCAIHYPTPLPLLPAYSQYGYTAEDYPAAHEASGEILSLPMYPELPEAAVERIGRCIEEFYDRG